MAQYNTTPAPGDILSNSQPILLANSQYLQTSVGRDHNFTNDDTTVGDGYHKSIHMIVQADQAPIANTLTFYQKITDGDTNLYASTSLQQGLRLTTFNSTFDYSLFGTNTSYPTGGPVATTLGGWTYLPGGLIMQYGFIVSTTNNGQTTVKFPVVFSAPPFSVTVSSFKTATSGINTADFAVTVRSVAADNFHANTLGSPNGYYWMAIGI